MYQIRPIRVEDNPAIAQVIRQVSKEHGLAPEDGFAVADPILDHLYEHYQQAHAAYWVITDHHEQILGGGGISPLQGDASCLELQKMYFRPALRGQGFAKKLLELAFEFAQQHGFNEIYLETTASLAAAVKLYEKTGFAYLDQPRGNTGHSAACEIWMLKTLPLVDQDEINDDF